MIIIGTLFSKVKRELKEAYRAKDFGVRVVTVRTTLVLENGEGALAALVPYFLKGLGGYVRPGTQIFPWVVFSIAYSTR